MGIWVPTLAGEVLLNNVVLGFSFYKVQDDQPMFKGQDPAAWP